MAARRADRAVLAQVAEHVVEATHDGLAVHDASGQLVGWNSAAVEITGWHRDEAERRLATRLPNGVVDLGNGRYVDVRRFSLRSCGRDYEVTLFADARPQVALRDTNRALEQRVEERTRELEQAQLEIVERLALAAEYRDDVTGEHTRRVGEACALVAEELGLPEDEVELIRRAAPLHDVGKIGIRDGILLKPERLTDEEREQVKAHTVIGARMLAGRRFALLELAEQIALTHHERWDGAGYPRGLQGEEIPLAGRITAVADVFDALTHERPYKTAWSVESALAELDRERGTQFDPRVVDAFLDVQEKLRRLEQPTELRPRPHRHLTPVA